MTSTQHHRTLLAAALACALGAAFTARVAQAETLLGVNSLAEAKANYQHDVAACRSGTLSEDRKTCMLEAQRAYNDARAEARHQGSRSSRMAREDTSATTSTDTSDSANTSGTSAPPKADRN